MGKKQAIPADARSALVATAVLLSIALLAEDLALGTMLGMGCVISTIYAMARIPLRYSVMSLAFLATILPNPGEGQPSKWAPPFTEVGRALLTHLNTIDRNGFLGLFPISLMDVFFLALGLIAWHRRVTKSKIDSDVVDTPKPLIQLAIVSMTATMFTWTKGLLFGGDFSMSLWQVNAVIYLPIVFLLFQAGFRGPEDHWTLAKLYLIAAGYKSALALYVVETQQGDKDIYTGLPTPVPYGTAHADSMLFSLAFVIVVAGLLEQVGQRWRRLAYGMIPLLMIGIQANNRRLAWVQIGAVLLILYFVSGDNRATRFVRRAFMVCIPFLVAYAIAGWNVQYGSLFKPVRILRSVVDAETDGSSQWREFENVNIIATLRDNLLFGTGYGHPYIEVIQLPAVDYALEKYIPHNSFLGLWGYAGFFGFSALTMLWVAGIFFAMRAYYGAREPAHRAAAIATFGAFPIYFLQCWGDLGLVTWTGTFLMGASISIGGKLAVASGQWQPGPVFVRR